MRGFSCEWEDVAVAGLRGYYFYVSFMKYDLHKLTSFSLCQRIPQ